MLTNASCSFRNTFRCDGHTFLCCVRFSHVAGSCLGNYFQPIVVILVEVLHPLIPSAIIGLFFWSVPSLCLFGLTVPSSFTTSNKNNYCFFTMAISPFSRPTVVNDLQKQNLPVSLSYSCLLQQCALSAAQVSNMCINNIRLSIHDEV
ncbi:uncharacterized protein DEA37_0005098, partial [Paragonimus westermani]